MGKAAAWGGATRGRRDDDAIHDPHQGYGRVRGGVLPDEKLLTEMGKFNEALVRAGVMLAGEGLHPSSTGARIVFSGAKRTVTDGPFPETNDLVAGFWLWQVKSKAEAIEWVKRCPNPMLSDSVVEIRQVFDPADFGDALTPALRAQEERLRAQAAKR